MKRSIAALVGLGAVTLLVLNLSSSGPSPANDDPRTASTRRKPEPVPTVDRTRRVLDAVATAPEMAHARRLALLDASDRIRHRLTEEEGDDEPDVGATIRSRLREVDVPEAEARAWYEDNRPMFGERSFEQSRTSIERLIAVDRVREELDAE